MRSLFHLRLSALAVVLLLAVSACSVSSTGLPSELDVRTDVELPCPGSVIEPPDDFEQVFEVVALPASPLHPNALQTTAREADDGSVYYFAKTGLWWRGDATFDLIVPEELQSDLAIGWGGPAEVARQVQVDCEAAESWMVHPGGYWLREPMCAEIIVQVGPNEQRVEIGLGTPCPGQAPPAGPSDG